jgi:pyridoxamine 5'-phosphate oxidase
MTKKISVAELRKDYRNAQLNEDDIAEDPILQFGLWFEQALQAKLPEPNAMTLATADAKGKPSARMVLLKDFDANGFVFFTNYNSHKASDLDENPHAALVFYWHELERQVRIEGKVKRISTKESDTYFHSRPLESRLGAWASPQSKKIENRAVVEKSFEALLEKYKDSEPPRPPHWGGYVIKPERVEFWQGRPGRLHDRILFKKSKRGTWKTARLAP